MTISTLVACDMATPRSSASRSAAAALVRVGVVRDAHDHALYPHTDHCVAQSNFTAAANETGFLDDHGKYDSVAEVQNLLLFDPKLLVTGEPVFPVAPDCCYALKGHFERPLPHSIGSKEALHRV